MIPLTLLLLAPPKPPADAYVGTYEMIRIIKGKDVSNTELPAQRVMVLELSKGGHWTMRDREGGFDGTWRINGKKLYLLTVNTSSGKLDKPEKWTLLAKPDRRNLIPIDPQNISGQMRFRYDPQIQAKLKKRMLGH